MKMAPVTCAAFFICLAQLVVWLLPSWSNANAAASTSSFQLLHRNLPTICGCRFKKKLKGSSWKTPWTSSLHQGCMVNLPLRGVCTCVCLLYHNWYYVQEQFTHLPTSAQNLELKKPQSCAYKLNCIIFEMSPHFHSFELGSPHAQDSSSPIRAKWVSSASPPMAARPAWHSTGMAPLLAS